MRVLHVMECTIGGTRRHLVDVARGERRAGLDVAVVASTLRQGDFEADLAALERDGVRVTRLAMVRRPAPLSDARHLVALQRILARERPDVVHTHASKAGALGRMASVLCGVGARVHTPHTFAFLFDAMFAPPARALYREIERGLAGHTARVVAVSASEGRTIRASGVVEPARVRVVPNGIDPRPWLAARPLERAELAADPDAPIVAVVGLLNAAKGQDLALEALFDPRLARVQLALVGHGELEGALRAQCARLGLDRRVRFLGFRTDVPRILAACDGLCLPSRWEGMPYVVLEAMASAKSVVATPVDGALDLVEHGVTGVLAREIGAAALAEALVAWSRLSPEQRGVMGGRARERVLARHSADAMVAGLVAVYREVA